MAQVTYRVFCKSTQQWLTRPSPDYMFANIFANAISQQEPPEEYQVIDDKGVIVATYINGERVNVDDTITRVEMTYHVTSEDSGSILTRQSDRHTACDTALRWSKQEPSVEYHVVNSDGVITDRYLNGDTLYPGTVEDAVTYTTLWVMDVEGGSPKEAAEEALRIQRDPESIATSFLVIPRSNERKIYEVDLYDEIVKEPSEFSINAILSLFKSTVYIVTGTYDQDTTTMLGVFHDLNKAKEIVEICAKESMNEAYNGLEAIPLEDFATGWDMDDNVYIYRVSVRDYGIREYYTIVPAAIE